MHALDTSLTPSREGRAAADCFHCGLPVPVGNDLDVVIDGVAQPMCCPGCQAVAAAIVAAGHSAYYRHRTVPARRAEPVPDFVERSSVYDQHELQQLYTRETGAAEREADLLIEGVTCAACVWLNERHLGALPGVRGVDINYSTRRARIRWDPDRIRLSAILQAIRDIGYDAHPWTPGNRQRVLARERGSQLRRVGVAAVLGMQVMILAVALYAGDWYGMEPRYRTFFRWVSLALAVPLVSYAALPFFRAAWRDLRHFRPGMDVPVALGIGIAFVASVTATWFDRGEVYFDSIAMFVFLLLGARYLEMAIRNRAVEGLEQLSTTAPDVALRVRDGDQLEHVPALALRTGDRVVVRDGDTVPADGVITRGRGSIDESLLTGESAPVAKAPGDELIAGSSNVGTQLEMEVVRSGDATVLSSIVRQAQDAHRSAPRVMRLADRIAPVFVAGVLILAAATAWYWYRAGSGQWLAITLSVLVVTCPCALSLATPAALTASLGMLLRRGVLVVSGDALETLVRATHVVFDKTGTLTTARPQVVRTEVRAELEADRCRELAAALEQQSTHPLAHALRGDLVGCPRIDDVQGYPGAGVTGSTDGERYVLGSAGFVASTAGVDLPEPDCGVGETAVLLAREGELLAVFYISTPLREDARELIELLQAQGRQVLLLSGDSETPTRRVAEELGIDQCSWLLTPSDKRSRVERLQREGAVVAAVGDGINDAPLLAQAQASVAMGGGTRVAASNAGLVLLHDRLGDLALVLRQARRTRRVINQNLAWALCYNLLALPAAVLGQVPPWLAAIGMSLSSLLVVLNAARLQRQD